MLNDEIEKSMLLIVKNLFVAMHHRFAWVV